LKGLILFSDAVFAIAITLLVIEIKIPDKEFLKEHGGLSDVTISRALRRACSEIRWLSCKFFTDRPLLVNSPPHVWVCNEL
jgi:hypothetical protein